MCTLNIVWSTSAGQLDFFKAGYGCLGCGHVMWQGIEEFVSIGLWPTSVTKVRLNLS